MLRISRIAFVILILLTLAENVSNFAHANETISADESNEFRDCEMVKFREWICDGEKIPKGSLTESVLTASEFPCLERFPTPKNPCDKIAVTQELSDGTKIEYCLKPNCLRLIATDSVQSPE